MCLAGVWSGWEGGGCDRKGGHVRTRQDHSVLVPEAVGIGKGVRTEGGSEKRGWQGVRRGATGVRVERGSHPPQRTQ